MSEPEYPYWREDFNEETVGYEFWQDLRPNEDSDEMADGYKIFMIMCNDPQFYQNEEGNKRNRRQVLQLLKDSTEENPIVINGEKFYAEKR